MDNALFSCIGHGVRRRIAHEESADREMREGEISRGCRRKRAENLVQYVAVRIFATALLLPFAAAGARVAVAPMEVSPYLDTEVSTNVAINTWRSDARQVGIRLQLEGTPTNNLEVAFGRDATFVANGAENSDAVNTFDN